jgi:hypothetical protein
MNQFKHGDRVRSTCVTMSDITGMVERVLDENTMEVVIDGRITLQLVHNWKLVVEHITAEPGTSADQAVQWAARRFQSPAPVDEVISLNSTRGPKQRLFTLEQHEVKYVAGQLLLLGVAFEVGTRYEGRTVLTVDPSRDALVVELLKLIGGV